MDVRGLAAELTRRLDGLLGLTERLVAVDSGSADAAGVNRVQELLADALEREGFACRRRSLAGAGDLLDAHRPGDERHVLVLGHADTVWPAGTAAGWPYRRAGDEITGPGVGDMKACLAMAVHAVGAAAEQRDLPSIRFLVVPDEELGSAGSRSLIEEAAAAAHACLTLEACTPEGGVVVARGAVGAVAVTGRGRTAHVTSGDGASAVSALAPLVAELEGLARPDDGVRVTAGVFRGGSARQVVPGEATIELDLRAPDAAAAERLLEAVRERVQRAGGGPVAVSLAGGFTRPAFTESAGTRALFDRAAAACGELGIPIVRRREQGGSDANFAAALGVPTLDGLGPVCRRPCSTDETVEVSSMPARGAVLGALLGDPPVDAAMERR